MSELHIFRQRESLISSQVLCKVKASDTNVLTSPLDLACASLVLLSPISSEAVVMSVSQSSNCEESFPFNMGISCNNEFLKMFSSEHYTKCLYICLILPQWVLWRGKV